MSLYHSEVFMPAVVQKQLPTGVVIPCYGPHANTAALTDRYGKIHLSPIVSLNGSQLIEAELDGGNNLVKFVVRCHYDETRDIIYVFCPRRGNNVFVKTVWLNLKTDKHRTLDKNKYARA